MNASYPPRQSSLPRPPRAVYIAATLVVILLTLVFAELSVRLFCPQWLRALMREQQAGHAVTVGSDAEWPIELQNGHFLRFKALSQFAMITREYVNRVHIDTWGGRMVRPVHAGRPLLFWFGDSFTFGTGVEDEDTFVSRVCSSLGRRCVNLGVPGSCLSDHLDILEARNLELGSPSDYVFVVYLGNDLDDMMVRSEAPPSKPPKPTINRNAPQALNRLNALAQPVFRHSYAAQLTKAVVLQVLNRRTRNVVAEPIFSIMLSDSDYARRAECVLSDNITRLESVASTLHFKYRFILIPDRHQISRALRQAKSSYYGLELSKLDPRLPNRIVARQLARRGIEYLDLTDDLEERGDLYYVKDGHLTTKGHAYVAERILAGFGQKLGIAR
jgi:hypothetical protein